MLRWQRIFLVHLREAPRRHNILVSSGVKPLEAEILEVLVDTMVGQCRWHYKVKVVDLLVQQYRVVIRA